MPTTATTAVASMAAWSETESGFQTQEGKPNRCSAKPGINPFTPTQRFLLLLAGHRKVRIDGLSVDLSPVPRCRQ